MTAQKRGKYVYIKLFCFIEPGGIYQCPAGQCGTGSDLGYYGTGCLYHLPPSGFRRPDGRWLLRDRRSSHRNDDHKRAQHLDLSALRMYRRTSRRSVYRSVTYEAWYPADPCRYPDTDCALFHQSEYHGPPRKSGTEY